MERFLRDLVLVAFGASLSDADDSSPEEGEREPPKSLSAEESESSSGCGRAGGLADIETKLIDRQNEMGGVKFGRSKRTCSKIQLEMGNS